ncbi:hypothetical protein MBLNU459_g3718t1 [Dothideomycetes sp. NU459]
MRQEIVISEAARRLSSCSFVDEADFAVDRQRFFELQAQAAAEWDEAHDSSIISERSSSLTISSLSLVAASDSSSLGQMLGAFPTAPGYPALETAFQQLVLQDASSSGSSQSVVSTSVSESSSSLGAVLGGFPMPPCPDPVASATEQPDQAEFSLGLSVTSVLAGSVDDSQASTGTSGYVSETETTDASKGCLFRRMGFAPRSTSNSMSVFDPPSDAGTALDSQQGTQSIVDAMENLSISSSLSFEDAILTGRALETVAAAGRARMISPMPKTPRVLKRRERVPRPFTSGCIAESGLWDAI